MRKASMWPPVSLAQCPSKHSGAAPHASQLLNRSNSSRSKPTCVASVGMVDHAAGRLPPLAVDAPQGGVEGGPAGGRVGGGIGDLHRPGVWRNFGAPAAVRRRVQVSWCGHKPARHGHHEHWAAREKESRSTAEQSTTPEPKLE